MFGKNDGLNNGETRAAIHTDKDKTWHDWQTGEAKLGVICQQVDLCDYKAYLNRYPDLKKAFGNDLTKAKNHYKTHGIAEKRNCGPDTGAAVDCLVSAWAPFEKCNKPCGEGVKISRRTITRQPAKGGRQCPILMRSKPCFLTYCPIDCRLGEWTDWGKCDQECGLGNHSRSRPVLQEPFHDGVECPEHFETKRCRIKHCPINCEVSAFTAWGKCSRSCDPGFQHRTRTITKRPAYGGKACPALIEDQPCEIKKCPIDCKVSEFTAWTKCSKTCGEGVKTRKRTILVKDDYGGRKCPPESSLTEEMKCKLINCPIHCDVSDWSKWGKCSEPCGPGIEKSTMTILTPAKFGGTACPTKLEKVRACKIRECPIDCEVSDWTKWGVCSKTCGPGDQKRSRTVTKPDQWGGKKCPFLEESRQCNVVNCPVHCTMNEWGDWDECSRFCGPGVQTRSRTVDQPPKFGGNPCPKATDTQQCNLRPCMQGRYRCAKEDDQKPCFCKGTVYLGSLTHRLADMKASGKYISADADGAIMCNAKALGGVAKHDKKFGGHCLCDPESRKPLTDKGCKGMDDEDCCKWADGSDFGKDQPCVMKGDQCMDLNAARLSGGKITQFCGIE